MRCVAVRCTITFCAMLLYHFVNIFGTIFTVYAVYAVLGNTLLVPLLILNHTKSKEEYLKREAYFILIKNYLLPKAKSKTNNGISTLQEPFYFALTFRVLLIFAHMPCLICIIIPCKPFHLL